MAREIRDEKQMETEVSSEFQDPMQEPEYSIQIPMTPEMEDQLVDIVMEDYEASKEAREKMDFGRTSKGDSISFDSWFKGLIDLYNSNREPKTIPWKFCSNRSLRMAASILDMLHARLFPAVVNDDLLRWKPGELNDVAKVERISKLMHWWFWVRSRMREPLDNWVKVILGYGDSIVESSWKAVPRDTGKSKSDPISGPDGMPLINPDGTPAVQNSRIIELFESTNSKIYLRDKFYLQEGSTDIQREPVILEDSKPYRDFEEGEAQQKYVNVSNLLKNSIPVSDEFMALPPEEQNKLKGIKIRNHPVKELRWYGNFDADGDGFAEDVRIIISPEHKIYLGGVRMTDITKSGKRPISFTKISSRIECPDQNWGRGVLENIKELCEEIDAIFNQMTDGNTLSILMPGFYDPGGDLDAPNLTLAPNKMTPVSNPQQNVFFPQVNIQTDRLVGAIQLVIQFIERLTAASSYVLGKESEIVGGSGTATRTNAIMQSAEQRFALPAERLREGAAQIANQHLDLLQLNIPPGLERRILGEKGEALFEGNELTQLGISGEFDAYLLPDPSMGSKETERELANMFYSVFIQNPIVGSDPAKIYQISADILKAYGKENDIVRYLGPEPPQDLIDSPGDENTLMVQGDFGKVKAQFTENHILHIMEHMQLQQSPSIAQIAATAPELVNQIMQFNQQHIQEHMMMMAQVQKLMQQGGVSAGSESGGKGATGSGTEGPGFNAGMEQTSGPLGQALNAQRAGQGGGYSPSQGAQ